MSYQVLARKWRPKKFTDLVGQDATVRMLSNALEQQRLHHAYLFTGTRGVGKTTIARIIAKCLNCESGVTSTPCETCNTCQAIDKGQFLDLFEIDAASRTKVEDTRELLENVPYPPTQGRYKIYLIDEVHMLSNHSFNALLKTLEEPPEHVKFLLATTDPQKLPVTILSRCLQFNLRRIAPEQISQHLAHICKAENIKAEDAALEQLAHAADGSMRDALSLLDQAIAYGSGSVEQEHVRNMLGSLSKTEVMPLVTAIANLDGKVALGEVRKLADMAPDFNQVLEEVIAILHDIAIQQVVPGIKSNDNDEVKTLAQHMAPEDVQLYYQIALLGRRDLAYSANPFIGFEMTVLRMLAFQPQTTSASSEKPKPIAKKPRPQPTQKTTSYATATATVATSSLTDWSELLPKLELSGMAYALAANCTLKSLSDNKVKLMVSESHQAMISDKLKERIQDALSRHFEKDMQLDFEATKEAIVTPQKMQSTEQDARLKNATAKVMQQPQIQQLVEMYDATVEVTLQD